MFLRQFKRLICIAGLVAAYALSGVAFATDNAAAGSAKQKVFRYAFPIAETGFDPAQISDLYSRVITANIFDSLYEYDYLARPLKLRPLLASGMPVMTNNYKTWTVSLRKGVLFADDAAFGGKKRELTADDVVYTYKRHYDPKNKSQNVYLLEGDQLGGLPNSRRRPTKRVARLTTPSPWRA